MKNFTYNQFVWHEVLHDISQQPGVPVTTDPDRWNTNTAGYTEIYEMWQQANFNPASIGWVNYYPGKHFSWLVMEQVTKDLGLKGLHRAWISKIDPGYMAPYHWDVDDNEQEYLKQGPIVRYTVIIKSFALGHVFILKDTYYHGLTAGEVIQWDDHRTWHSGINAGMEPNYMLHVLGY